MGNQLHYKSSVLLSPSCISRDKRSLTGMEIASADHCLQNPPNYAFHNSTAMGLFRVFPDLFCSQPHYFRLPLLSPNFSSRSSSPHPFPSRKKGKKGGNVHYYGTSNRRNAPPFSLGSFVVLLTPVLPPFVDREAETLTRERK